MNESITVSRFSKQNLLFLLLFLVAILEFWKLGVGPVNSFDEARFGANACEMRQNGDFLNLYYQGKPDAWLARPPLKAWLTMSGYFLFGYNAWGLRMSSGLFVLLFFYFAFQWMALYLTPGNAFLGGLMLLSVKGVVGFHVGRNGDMDAEFNALLMGFLYFFSLYLHFHRKNAILFAGCFLAFAFWFKTMACFFYLPGIFLYLLASRRLLPFLKDNYAWYAIGIFLTGILSWTLIVLFCGTRYHNTPYAGDNAIETMVIYDIWMRFTSSHFDGHPVHTSYGFFFTNLDVRFNVWNYFSYLGLAIFFFQLKKGSVSSAYQHVLPFCAFILFPAFVLFTFGMHKLDWYSTPILPLLTMFALYALENLVLRWSWFGCLFAALLCFTLVRHALYTDRQTRLENETALIDQHQGILQKADTLWVAESISQSIYLRLLWMHKPIKIAPNLATFTAKQGRIGISSSDLKGKRKVRKIAEYVDERLDIRDAIIRSTP